MASFVPCEPVPHGLARLPAWARGYEDEPRVPGGK